MAVGEIEKAAWLEDVGHDLRPAKNVGQPAIAPQVTFEFGATLQAAVPLLLIAAGAASLPLTLAMPLTTRSVLSASLSMTWAFVLAVVLIGAGLMFGGLLAASAAVDPMGVLSGDLVQQALLLNALPAVLAGLVAAGTLAALFSTGQAALFSAAGALSHDVLDEMVDPRGPAGRRILIARLALVAVRARLRHLARRRLADRCAAAARLGARPRRLGQFRAAGARHLVAALQRDRCPGGECRRLQPGIPDLPARPEAPARMGGFRPRRGLRLHRRGHAWPCCRIRDRRVGLDVLSGSGCRGAGPRQGAPLARRRETDDRAAGLTGGICSEPASACRCHESEFAGVTGHYGEQGHGPRSS